MVLEQKSIHLSSLDIKCTDGILLGASLCKLLMQIKKLFKIEEKCFLFMLENKIIISY